MTAKVTDGKLEAMMLPVRNTLEVISGKWKILILISMIHGNKRYGEIERSIPKITSKVLAKELKDMEQSQLIKRNVYNDYPIRVEYTLTDFALTLEKVLVELYDWGVKYAK